MKEKDLDNYKLVKSKFYEAMPDVPQGLDEDVIKSKILSEQEHKVIPFKPKKNYKSIASIAACFILVFGVFMAAYPYVNNPNRTANFKSEAELNSVVADLEKWGSGESGSGSSLFQDIYTTDDLKNAEKEAVTDGRYIYYAYHNYNSDKNKNKIYIFHAAGDDTQLVNIMEDVAPSDDYDIDALFLVGNSLSVILSGDADTIARTYDIANPKEPALINEMVQDGRLMHAYMIDGAAYLASYYGVAQGQNDDIVPQSAELKAEPKNIYRFKNIRTANYMVIGAIDVKTGKSADKPRAILGACYEAYITDGCLYVASDNAFYTDNLNEIEFIKYNLKSGKATFDAPEWVNLPKYTAEGNQADADRVQGLIQLNNDRLISVNNRPDGSGNEVILYDITDREKPKVVDSQPLDGVYGDVNKIRLDNGKYAMPCYFADETRRYYGVVTFETKADQIVLTHKFVNHDENLMYAGECIFVGDFVYSFDINDNAPDDKKITVYSYKYSGKEDE